MKSLLKKCDDEIDTKFEVMVVTPEPATDDVTVIVATLESLWCRRHDRNQGANFNSIMVLQINLK